MLTQFWSPSERIFGASVETGLILVGSPPVNATVVGKRHDIGKLHLHRFANVVQHKVVGQRVAAVERDKLYNLNLITPVGSHWSSDTLEFCVKPVSRTDLKRCSLLV